MDRKLVKNYIFSVLYQLLSIVMPLITIPYTTRVLGLELLSINAATSAIIQIFVSFGLLGVAIYGNREIAKVRDDKKECSKTFLEIFTMQCLSMSLSTIAFIIYAIVVGDKYMNILLIQSITLLSVALDITWFFYGVEDFKKVSIRNMLVKVIGVILIFRFVKGTNDLPLFVFLNVMVGICGQLVMWIQIHQYISFTKFTLKDVLAHVKPNIALFVPQIAITIYSVLDIMMLRILYSGGIDQVGLYEQTQKFIRMFLFFITSIGSVMLPRVTNTFHKGDLEGVQKYLSKTIHLSLYLSLPMIFGICGMVQKFVDWFFTNKDYAPVGLLIQLMSPIILFIALSNVFGTQYLVPTGKTKFYTISVISGAIVNFCVNFISIPTLGAIGAIAGSICAELTVTIIQFIYTRKDIKVRLKVTEILSIIFASSIMFIVVVSIGTLLKSNFLTSVIQIVLGGITYLICLLVIRPPFVKEMLKQIKDRKVFS